MAGFWVTNQAISWWNMIGACEDFSDASNVINCVWGAVTTSITAAGAFWVGIQTVGRIQTWANNNGITFGGFKRDLVAGSVDAELLDAFSALMFTPVTHLGVFEYAGLGLNGTLAWDSCATKINRTSGCFRFHEPRRSSNALLLLGPHGEYGRKQQEPDCVQVWTGK
jgi:hypothetical protein